MQQVHYIIRDCGDGSQTLDWFKGSMFTVDALYESAEKDKYQSYASGDGVQLTTLEFPDYVNLDQIGGINWCDTLPGDYGVDEFDVGFDEKEVKDSTF